jgi:hypothetical protein
MKRVDQIARNLTEIIFERDWSTENSYKKQLEKLKWESAVIKNKSSNSISDLVYHVDYYINGILEFFETGKLTIQDKFSFDSPSISSIDDWSLLVDNFWNHSKQFINRIKSMDDSILDRVFIKKEYGTYQRNFDGLLVHLSYHLAQITYLRKIYESQ